MMTRRFSVNICIGPGLNVFSMFQVALVNVFSSLIKRMMMTVRLWTFCLSASCLQVLLLYLTS